MNDRIKLLNIDCMEYMRSVPDKHFDLAIVDPPYGLGKKLVSGGTWAAKYQSKDAEWDVAPDHEFFMELFRVSKNWIIWGGNYFSQYIPGARHFIPWVKPNMAGMHTMSDVELALTSFDKNSRSFILSSQTDANECRFHPCQKPVKLYQWLLETYSEPEQRILDTHLGSGSSAIAAHYFGAEFVGCELDKDYYDAACKRFRAGTSQVDLFSEIA